MALLSAQQIFDIKNVLQTVTDQFFVTPVTLFRAIDSLDVNNEDRLDQKYVPYELLCMFEVPLTKGGENSGQGATQFYDVKVTFNYRDILAAGLGSNNETILNPTRDYFEVNGKRYKIIPPIALDGPIEAENVLLVIAGKQQENKT